MQAEGELQMLNTLAVGGTPSGSSPRQHQHHCFGAAVQQVSAAAKAKHRRQTSDPLDSPRSNGNAGHDAEAGGH